jgi:hypothetical protein
MAIFADMVSEQATEAVASYDGPRWCWLVEQWGRPVLGYGLVAPEQLLSDGAVIDVVGALTCDAVMRHWLGLAGEENAARRRVALELQDALHGFEMERAARPPQVTYSMPLSAPVPEDPYGSTHPVPAVSAASPATLPVPAPHPSRPGLIETTHQVRAFFRDHLNR